MKIIYDPENTQGVQIITKDGRNIGNELKITHMEIILSYDHVPNVVIRCIPDSIELNKIEELLLDDDSDKLYRVTPITKIKKGE